MGDAMNAAKASLRRCCAAPNFFSTFYEHFFENCPEAEPMFADTDFDRQYKLLQHALHLLLIYPGESESEPSILTRVAERHSQRGLKIDPAMYPKWVDSMVQTVREFDPRFDQEIENAWRKTLAPGIEYMRARY